MKRIRFVEMLTAMCVHAMKSQRLKYLQKITRSKSREECIEFFEELINFNK